MRSSILLVILSATVLGGCTSAYKTGQTPDDVYFSPERQHDEYVTMKDNGDRRYQGDDDYYDDRYLRMKVHNRVMWSDLNDWYYYDRYSYAYNYGYGSWNNPYNSWNYYYNPYCNQYYNPYYYSWIIKGPSVQTVKPRNFSLTSYTNTNYNNANGRNVNVGKPIYNNSYNNSNNKGNSRGFGNVIRNVLSGGNTNSYNNSNYSNNSSNSGSVNRTYSPSNSSSSSSSSSGGGGVSRPVRH
jgi:hypothetical protein